MGQILVEIMHSCQTNNSAIDVTLSGYQTLDLALKSLMLWYNMASAVSSGQKF